MPDPKDEVIRNLEGVEEAAPGLPFYVQLPTITPEELREIIRNMGDGTAQGGEE